MCWHFVNLAVTRNLAVAALRVCGGILEFTASLRSRGQGCSVPALPSSHLLPGDEDEEGHGGVEHGADGLVSDEDIVDGGSLVQSSLHNHHMNVLMGTSRSLDTLKTHKVYDGEAVCFNARGFLCFESKLAAAWQRREGRQEVRGRLFIRVLAPNTPLWNSPLYPPSRKDVRPDEECLFP